MTTTRNPSEVDALLKVLSDELESLPAFSIFGEPNAPSLKELGRYHRALVRYTMGHKVRCKEVEEWLNGYRASSLNDMLT